MEAVEVSPRYVSVGYEYVQNAGREWRAERSICYHSYLIPENHVLPGATAFAYEGSIASYQQVEDSVEQPRTTHGSRTSLESESSDSDLSTFILEARDTIGDE